MGREVTAADRLFRQFAANGDPRALGEVYDLLAPELLRIALHTARDAAEAEDVLQATFVAVIERADRFDRTQPVMPWLVGILANEARKARARAARTPEPDRLEHERPRDPELEAERAELLAQLDSALERVPVAFRPVLTLRLRHGLSVPEIAAALERPSGTVRSQLARGTEQLRRSLPAGLAGALLFAAAPTRGLAAVRDAIVEHAALLHGSSTATVIIGGVLAVKKWIAAAVVLAGALWFLNSTRVERAEQSVESTAQLPSPLTSDDAAPAEPALAVDERSGPAREAQPSVAAHVAEKSSVTHGGSLVVHASWPDGAPAAGELVLLTPVRGRSDDALVRATDENGSARFDELDPGICFVRLQRGREGTVTVIAGKTNELVLAILDGVTVEGRVVDARGDAVAHASVWLSERYRSDIGHIVASSDEHGAFTLRCVGPDYWLGARKRGFAPSSLRGVRGTAGDRVAFEIRLEHAASALRGEVRDTRGNALSGALVLLGDAPAPSARNSDGSFTPRAFPQQTRADANGRFEFECAPLGVQPIQARAPLHAPLAATFDVIVGDRNECVLSLQPEARVVGRVRSMDGQALAGAWIHTATTERFADVSTWSSFDGSFELAGLGTGTVTLVAQRDEHGRNEREFTLLPGTTTEWEVALTAVPKITGQVVDARGNPLAEMIVVALHPDDRSQRTRSDVTNASGQFEIDGLDTRSYLLWVQRPLGWREFPLLEIEDVWPDAGPVELRVPEGAQGGSITAEIVTSDGTPLVGAELQVGHAERRLWRSFASEGERGAIRVECVPAGTIGLDVRHPDHPWKRLGERRIEEGETLELGRIVLEPSGRLRVRITGADELHASLTVALIDANNHESSVARIVGSELTSGPLAPGTHKLLITGDGVRQVRREFTIEETRETEFALTLERCGVRTVTFALPPDVPMPKWIACSLFDAENKLVWGGNADCTSTPPVAKVSAPPGSYVLMVGGEHGLTGRMELVVTGASNDESGAVLDLVRRP